MIRYFIYKIFLVILLIFCAGNIYSQATLISDQDDYGPGSTATFTGGGFQAGEQVQLIVLHIDDTPDSGEDHGSWTVTADADGNFITTWHVCEDDCLGSTLRATADGISSGLHAEVIFTDGNLSSVTIGAQSGTINYGTATSVTYPVSVIANASPAGSFSVTMSISGLPAGVSSSFSPAVFTMAPGTTQSVILTITTLNTTKVPISPSFNITAAGGGGSGSKSATGTLTITKKIISGSITVNNKIYDGSTSATIASRTLSGALAGDVVSYTGGTAIFSDKNAGTGKTVNATGLGLTGADAGNYSVNTTASATADISQKTITGSINAQNKVYDGNTIAVINNRSLTGKEPGDAVSLTGGTGNFDTKNVGIGKTVTLSGYSLTGADAGNYNLTSVGTTVANITALGITGSFTASDKVYDGNISATILTRTANSIIVPDIVNLVDGTASFSDKNVGTGKVVTLTGATLSGVDAGNYILTSVGTTTANITALSITGSFTASNKVYDGTTTATVLTSNGNGIIAPDAVSLTGGTAAFDTKNVGTGKTVILTGAILSGADAGNYNLTSIGTTTANISALGITGSFSASDKVYDGNATAAVLTRTANSIIAPDVVSLTGGTASFDNKNVGTGKTVTLTGAVLSGADAGNYDLSSVGTTTANITSLAITGSFTSANKIYDGNTNATILTRTANGIIAPDDVSLTNGTATFDNKNVGTAKIVTLTGAILSGDDAGNYNLTSVETTIANITALEITGSFTASDKVYDGNINAIVLSRTPNGIIAPDLVNLTGGTASFDNRNVGNGKTVTLAAASISGDDAGNYTLTSVGTTTANITALGVTGAFTASNKIYDGNASATVLTRTVNSIIVPDVVSLTGGTASFDNKNVGTGKIVTLTGAGISGADAGNYTLTSVGTATADITQKALTITATGINKVYDGTTAATVTLTDNRLAGDVFNDTYTNAAFSNENVGNGISVNVSGIAISGLDAANYSFNTTTTTSANITPLSVASSVTVTPNTQQYSDVVTYCAKIVGGAIGSTAATSVTFKVGTQTVAANVPLVVSGSDLKATYTGPLVEPPIGSPTSGQMAPGVHTVTACFNNVSTNFSLSNATTNLTILKENDPAFYTGGEFASTGSATSSSAGIRLSATVTDTLDGHLGNIRNARVHFKIQPYSCTGAAETIVYTSWRPVSLISAADTTIGTASLDTIFNIGSCDAKIYVVTVEVSGYYTGNSVPVTVTVARTLNDFITGGGHQDFSSGTGNKSGGIYRSSDNSKVNFGFNVKYNKNKTNLQGNVNVIIRSDNKVYQVKGIVGGSNGALSVDAVNHKANLTSKVSMIDLATGLTVPNGSNATMELKMSDKAEPGANIDTYGITIWSGNAGGSLLYSSNWSGVLTNEVAINGGNIQVRSSSSARIGADTTGVDTTGTETPTDVNNIPNSPYAVKVFPNPTDNKRITVSIVGSDQGNKPVQLYIHDVTGKLIYTDSKFCLHNCEETVLNLDGRYSSGTYLINVVIDEKTYHQKLVVQ